MFTELACQGLSRASEAEPLPSRSGQAAAFRDYVRRNAFASDSGLVSSLWGGVHLLHGKRGRCTVADRAALAEDSAGVREGVRGRTLRGMATRAGSSNWPFRIDEAAWINNVQPRIWQRHLLRVVHVAFGAVPPVARVPQFAEIDGLLAEPKNDVRTLLVLTGVDTVN